MKCREFLKLIGIAPVVPSVLMAKEKTVPVFRPEDLQKCIISDEKENIVKYATTWTFDTGRFDSITTYCIFGYTADNKYVLLDYYVE